MVLNVEILDISLRIARIKKKVGMKIKKLKKVGRFFFKENWRKIILFRYFQENINIL